eukprot:scaffold323192_cov21-Tisochrysis_lutea.AAC.1
MQDAEGHRQAIYTTCTRPACTRPQKGNTACVICDVDALEKLCVALKAVDPCMYTCSCFVNA